MLNKQFWQHLEDYDREILGVFRDPQAAQPVIDFLQSGNVVADVGCGPGQSFKHTTGCRKVFAIDASTDLLAKAKETISNNHWQHISLIHKDMAEYSLPEQADITLLSMSFFPDGLHHAIRILTNIQKQTVENGRIMMIVPCMESRMYWFHLWYRFQFEQGVSEEELQLEQRDIYNHILTYGYYHNPLGKAHGQIFKEWIKEELYDLLKGLRFKEIEIKKHILPWDVYLPDDKWFHDHEPIWYWRVTMVNP